MIAAGNKVADETEPTTMVQDQATQADSTTTMTLISSASRSICAQGAKVITKTRVLYSAKQIWLLLDDKFSADVTGTHYADFHAMMKVVIPGNEHPTKALQAFHAAVKRLRLNGIEFPEQLEALILSWKLPSAYNTTQTMINFAAHNTDTMRFDTISNAIVRAWEGQLGLPFNKNQAQKLSAVCRAPQQPPQFQQQQRSQQQQQQQPACGDSNSQGGHGGHGGGRGGNRGRGNQGGKGKQTQQQQQQHQHGHVASLAKVQPQVPTSCDLLPHVPFELNLTDSEQAPLLLCKRIGDVANSIIEHPAPDADQHAPTFCKQHRAPFVPPTWLPPAGVILEPPCVLQERARIKRVRPLAERFGLDRELPLQDNNYLKGPFPLYIKRNNGDTYSNTDKLVYNSGDKYNTNVNGPHVPHIGSKRCSTSLQAGPSSQRPCLHLHLCISSPNVLMCSDSKSEHGENAPEQVHGSSKGLGKGEGRGMGIEASINDNKLDIWYAPPTCTCINTSANSVFFAANYIASSLHPDCIYSTHLSMYPLTTLNPIYVCAHNCVTASCAKCKGSNKPWWMLDSGASKHFPYDLNDFVDYREYSKENRIALQTATSSTSLLEKALYYYVSLTGMANFTQFASKESVTYQISHLDSCHLVSS
jgi:hypothetical protein